MNTQRSSSRWLVVAVLAVLAAPTIVGQDRSVPDPDLERSWAIQARLAQIEANRANFVHELLMAWTPYVDNQAYDLFEELGPIAMRAPVWQLYGASLVGDFPTMMRVLKGEGGASPYINALVQPEAKAAYYPSAEIVIEPNAFNDTSDHLVYTPIAPCRVVDTRGTGARTGIIPAGGTRSFDLESDAFVSGQGGTGPCAGLPSFSYYGWAVNITVTGYSATGWIKAWGYTGAEPAASIINYSAHVTPSVANGLILTGCYACVDDITVKAYSAATHVIIDVIGYFQPAGVAASGFTRLAGTPVSIAAGASAGVYGAACPAGTQLIGGEVTHPGIDTTVAEFNQLDADQWRAYMINKEGVSRSVTVYSRCMDLPVKLP